MAKSKPKQSFATTPPRMTVLTDHAIYRDSGEQLAEDLFELEAKLGLAFDVLRHKDTQEPVTIAIYGDWGVGKTSGMRWLSAQLEAWSELNEEERDGHPRTRTIWFEPWKYQNREDVWRGLIAEVILKTIDIDGAEFGTIKDAVRRFGGFLGRSFINVLASTKLKAGVDSTGIEVNVAELRGIVDDFKETNHPEKAYLNEFEETFKEWVDARLADDERMVLFIDDLDRCLPDVTLEVLEALKLYLNIPKLVFVVGLDRGIVDAIVGKHYEGHGVQGLKAGQYLDKIFQVEVNISPSQHQVKEFIRTHVNELNEVSGGAWNERLAIASKEINKSRKTTIDAKVIIESHVEQLCRDNPREVKRLLNSMLMRAVSASKAKGGADGGEALRFVQGAQVFLIDRYIRRDFIGAENELLRVEVQEFFEDWSKFLDDYPDFKPKSIDSHNETEDAKRWREVEKTVEGASSSGNLEYDELRKSIPHYTANGESVPLNVLDDIDAFWELMRIPFNLAVAAFTALPYAARRTGKPVDRTTGEGGPTVSPSLRNAIARWLDMPAEDVRAEHFNEVGEVNLSGASIRDSDLKGIQHLTNLAGLYLIDTNVTDQALENIRALKNLKMLSIPERGLTDLGLEHVKEIKSLTHLQYGAAPFTGEGLAHIKELKNLTHLHLGATGVTDRALEYVKEIGSLTWLDLEGTEVTDLGLEHIKELKNLTKLFLGGTKVSDMGCKYIKELRSLTYLKLSGTGVTDLGLEYIKELRSLTWLDLEGTEVTDLGLEHIKELENLTKLSLRGTKVSDTGLEHIQELEVLASLGLMGTDVTDAGLVLLGDLKSLAELDLMLTEITDGGLQHLKGLQSLRWLHLAGTDNVTNEGCNLLKAALPRLEIYR